MTMAPSSIPVNGGNVGVVDARQQLRFAFEARHAPGVRGKSLGQHFDGDVAIQLGVAGAIYLSHAARADGGQDFVVTELLAGRKRHLVVRAKFSRSESG